MKKLLPTILATIPAFGGVSCVAPTKILEPNPLKIKAKITQETPYDPEYINFGGYALISPHDKHKEELVFAVGQILSTEEGVAVIQRAFELHKNPIKIQSWTGGRSRFTAAPVDKTIGGIVWIDFDSLANSLYKDGKGDLHDNSLQRVIFHELLHAADIELIKTPMAKMTDEYEAYQFLLTRHKAMLPVENAFMAAHFLEKPFDGAGRAINPKEVGLESFLLIHPSMRPCNKIIHAEATAIYSTHGKQFGLR